MGTSAAHTHIAVSGCLVLAARVEHNETGVTGDRQRDRQTDIVVT